jgi:predicted unusual protein kinase regulating ubiquinone biosynthesis (AarF/ABC1/UbiB family)
MPRQRRITAEGVRERLAKRPSSIPTSTLLRSFHAARAMLDGGRAAFLSHGVDVARVEATVRSLGELKGVAMKVGQTLSYVDDGLPDEARAVLAVLQTCSQPTPFVAIERIVRADLGARAQPLLERLSRFPAASASIGQVHRGRLPDGTLVAVKVRHPGVDDAIRADFRAAWGGLALANLLLPGADVATAVAEAQAAFLEECDYALEARRQLRFAELWAGDARLTVPRVWDEWCGPRVLTSTWHQGTTYDALLASSPPQPERDRLGEALYDFYVGSLYRFGLFNADPHPGNLLFERGGRVVVLDHGCVRELAPELVRGWAALSRGVRGDDAGEVRRALVVLGGVDPGTGRAYEVTRDLLRAFYAPTLEPGRRRVRSGLPRTMRELAAGKRDLLRLHLPGRLLFLLRVRFGLYAVLSRLGAEVDLHARESSMVDAALTGA